MLKKVISGFQNGADISGVRAAKAVGFSTGGSIPKGFKTLDGSKPEYELEYGAIEHASPLYPPRTELNVKNSDGTIRFAKKFGSSGEKCTLKNIKWYNKPYIDVDVNNPISKEIVIQWIRENNIEVLNVAGNSEETAPGIEKFVFEYLLEVFKELK